MRGILLEDERVMCAMRLAASNAYLNIMRKAGLENVSHGGTEEVSVHTLIAAYNDRALSLSFSIRGLLPRISGI